MDLFSALPSSPVIEIRQEWRTDRWTNYVPYAYGAPCTEAYSKKGELHAIVLESLPLHLGGHGPLIFKLWGGGGSSVAVLELQEGRCLIKAHVSMRENFEVTPPFYWPHP